MFIPTIISFDYETSGLNYWEKDFRVLSCAFAYRAQNGDLTAFMTYGEPDTLEVLKRAQKGNIPLLCHNLQFEYGVTKHRFPEIDLGLIQYDTMRIVQVYDNGGPNDRMELSLVKCAERVLEGYFDHKDEAYTWLRENGYNKPGQNLDKLPKDIFERYNLADAEITLKIWETVCEYFKKIKYDWTMDHSLYRNISTCIANSRSSGALVDRDKLESYRQEVGNDIRRISGSFRQAHITEIEEIEEARKEAWTEAPKSDRGKANRKEKVESQEVYEKVIKFNPGSGKQLAELFVGKLGFEPVFLTPKGSASTKAAHLGQFGEGGLMLQNKKKRELVLNQTKSLLGLSEADGRWHIDLKSTGTKTGRFAGGKDD